MFDESLGSENLKLIKKYNRMLIRKYQASWVEDFQKIKEVLEIELQSPGISIEHVGSTSIPHLAAKPIIDIDIVYDGSVQFATIKRGLENLAYYHNGDQGIEGREVFKRKKGIDDFAILDEISHHLYVCALGSEELQKHLAFRDYLREDEESRLKYELMKYEIAELALQDRKEYARLKETMARSFVDSILQKSASFKNSKVAKQKG